MMEGNRATSDTVKFFAEGVPQASGYGESDDAAVLPSYGEIMRSDESMGTKLTALYTVTRDSIQQRLRSGRPWSEFFDRDYFCKPQGMTDFVNRLNTNIPYFYSNYVVLCLLCNSYIMLVNLPFFICAALLAGFYVFVRSRSAALAVAEHSDGKIYFTSAYGYTPMQLYIGMGVFGVLAFYLTNGSSVIFWIVFVSLGVVVGHSGFRRPPTVQNSDFQFA